MADTSRPFFQLRPGRRLGDRLVWRFPFRSREIARQLMPVVRALRIIEPPKQITLGYYRRLDDPPGAVAFMPATSPLAIATLGIETVQRRICEDLAREVMAGLSA